MLGRFGGVGAAIVSFAVSLGFVSASVRDAPAQEGLDARTRVITLGTRSGPFPVAARAQASNVIVVRGSLYVVDAGDGVTRRLAETGLPFQNVEAIFLSHLHDDHMSGLASLMSVEYDFDRRTPVNVYGPGGTERIVGAALEFLKVNSDIRLSDGTRVLPIAKIFAGHDVEPGVAYKDAYVTVRAVENSHFHFSPGSPAFGKTKSYSYRFDTADKTVVFTGDTGPSDAVVELAKGADILVTEVNSYDDVKALRVKDGSWARWSPDQQASFDRHMKDEHLTPDDVGRMAARAGVKAVVLTHLSASSDPRDDYERYAATVRRTFTGPVHVASDLSEY